MSQSLAYAPEFFCRAGTIIYIVCTKTSQSRVGTCGKFLAVLIDRVAIDFSVCVFIGLGYFDRLKNTW